MSHEINIMDPFCVNELFVDASHRAKPFLKWAGGKSQLLNAFKELYPTEFFDGRIEYYFEPFIGSGAVFFDIIRSFHIKKAYLYDINEELILTYKVIQKDVHGLIKFLDRYSQNYLKLDRKDRIDIYYEIRNNYNSQRFNIDYSSYSENWIPRAAQMIFLNKTCFNGLFRFNSKGEFNTSAGDYINPQILNSENLRNVSKALENTIIKCCDYSDFVKDLKRKSFVYFDPPYRPISKTANFTSYSKDSFGDDEQIKLSQLFKELDEQNFKLMLSNSDPKNIDADDNFFDDLYEGFNITRVPARRMINSKASLRGFINEIVVTNY